MAGKSSTALRATGIAKRFGARHALVHADLDARYGEIHGLLGPNGAGKTTLLRVLLGLVRRDAGTVTIFGKDVPIGTAPVPDGVAGFVESPAFYPYLSARQNLQLLARLDRQPPPSFDALLADAGLDSAADVPVAGFSAGMRQRLGLAACLLRRPRLLLLDEPTNSLDPAAAHETAALLRRLAAAGTAVVLSSHDLGEVEALCATVTVITRGRIVFAGPTREMQVPAAPPVYELFTNRDDVAIEVARAHAAIAISVPAGGGLEVSGDQAALDAFMIALAQHGVAVRGLQKRAASFESLFLELTNRPGDPS